LHVQYANDNNVQFSNRSLNEELTPTVSNRFRYNKQVSNVSDMEFENTMGQPDLDTLGKFFSNNNVSSPQADDTALNFS